MWEKGYKVVYGVRTTRNEGAVIQYLRKLAYRLINSLSEVKVPTDAGDFRLIDRLIIEHLRSLTDRNPYLRGYISTLGYPQIGVSYERPQRSAGVSKFTLLKLITLGVDGITSQSTRPLHYITLFGFALSLIAVLMTVFYGLSWLLGFENETRGFPTLVLLQLFAIGMNAVFLGIMGEYIGRIFNNVRGHPVAIVEKIIECGVEMKSPESTIARNAGEKSH